MIIVYIRISVNVFKFLCHSVSGMMSAANSHTLYSFVLCRGIAKAGMRKKRSKETDSLSLSADLSKKCIHGSSLDDMYMGPFFGVFLFVKIFLHMNLLSTAEFFFFLASCRLIDISIFSVFFSCILLATLHIFTKLIVINLSCDSFHGGMEGDFYLEK